jgi:acyl-CoA synthetase (AMP-forming)/AMP-acid ligase II
MEKPVRLLHEILLRSARRHAEKIALVVEGKPFTYDEVLQAALRLSAALQKHGVKRGDRVAIYMDNTFPAVVSIFATLMSGGVFLMINPQTKRDKLEFILNDSEAVLLLTDGHLAAQFVPALEQSRYLKAVIASGNLKDAQNAALPVEPFDEVLQKHAPVPEPAFVIPNDLAALIYTSGSTGFPKGVMMAHQNMVFATGSLCEYLRLTEDERIMLMLPMAFDYGLYQLFMAFNMGATLIVERSFIFPTLVYKRIREFKATVFPGVPTIYATLIAAHQKSGLTFPSIRKVTNTAAALPTEYLEPLKKIFPNALIFKMYGLTECKRVAYLEPELLDKKPGSVGKAIPGTEVFLRSPQGEPVPPGQPGILYVRGPHVMVGYWKREDQTAKMLVPGPLPGERVLCTHDWFKMDDEGFLYFVGRSDDIIKTRGEKVSPIEIENVLYRIPQIKEAAVIGVPDALLGQAIRAFVVAENGLTEKEIKRVCSKHLENFMVPHQIVFLDALPKSPNGKIDKKALKESR